MGFLSDNCVFCAYTKEVADASSFSCGLEDMDDFFRVDAFDYAAFKMGQSYCFRLTESPDDIVCAFTLSNDSIRIYDLPRSRRDLMLHITRHRKRLNRYPGVLLGRIGVNVNYLRRGIGSETLDFIKEWFSDTSARSGCRFIIVDALNTPNVIDFYQKNAESATGECC